MRQNKEIETMKDSSWSDHDLAGGNGAANITRAGTGWELALACAGGSRGMRLRGQWWLGLSEQFFRFDKWNACRGD
jgi:hypothetical protein